MVLGSSKEWLWLSKPAYIACRFQVDTKGGPEIADRSMIEAAFSGSTLMATTELRRLRREESRDEALVAILKGKLA